MKPKKNPYTFFKQFCLRTPLFPVSLYQKITDATINDATFADIWNNPIIREAIYLASPELYEEIQKWIQGEISDPKTIRRLRVSFLKYIARISSRCTPFGLFAGCSLGVLDKETNIRMGKTSKHRRQTRFDMNFLVALSQELSKQEKIKKDLVWYPNSSLYRIGEQFRYVEYQYDKNTNREHSLEAVQYTPYLKDLLNQAIYGATLDELASNLVEEDISIDDATDYVDQLVDNQILVSELEPAVTGNDFVAQLIHVLRRLDEDRFSNILHQLSKSLEEIDTCIGNSAKQYKNISTAIREIHIPFKQKFLFQTDVYPEVVTNKLHQQWGYRLNRLFSLFSKTTPVSSESHLDRFKNAFTKRYETREMPLTTVLDTEIGIGYLQHQDASDSTVFLDDLQIPIKISNRQTYELNQIQDILDRKLHDLPPNTLMMTITDQDFSEVKEQWQDLPDTISAMTELVMIEGEERMVISSIGGSSAANLLGRFTTGSNQMLDYVKTITVKEQQMHPEAILAEIVHLPQSRTGNVIRRATLRDYEIPYLGKSSVPPSKQISVDDILISVQHGQVILRSKKHHAFILPRLTNAHNYSANSLPIYQFLCDLQTQKLRSGIGFSWGALLERKSFLPRVCYKEFILSKARWIIKIEEIKHIIEGKDFAIIDIARWRATKNLPKYVQLVEGDNTLLVNLENKSCIDMLWDTVKKRTVFILEEFLFDQKNCIVKDLQNNGYVNQLIISFYNKEKLAGSV